MWKREVVALISFCVSLFCFENTLNVTEYLNQVVENNEDFTALKDLHQSYMMQSKEGSLLFTPSFISKVQAGFQKDPQFIPYFPVFLTHSTLINETFQFGVEQTTPIGLDWQLASTSNLSQLNLDLGNLSPFEKDLFKLLNVATDASVTWYTVQGLQFTQHLWQNGFGAKTRAQAKQVRHGALAQSYQEKFNLQQAKTRAESVYWQLVMARALREIRLATLSQAKELASYIEEKKKESLVLESEVYQALSILNASQLDYERARENEIEICLAFNSLRGVLSADVSENLSVLTPALIASMAPKQKGERSDLKAQREMVQSQAASNAISVQNLLPQFDITGIIGLQGVGTDFGRSFNRSFSNPELGVAVIMQLNIPLSPYKMSNIRRAYKSNTHSAKLNFERQKFEQDQEWKRLTTRLEENLQLLGFLYKNEEVQKAKFENAESEYSRGLNTVFVVTGAQNDYQSSKIVILQTFQTLIEILLNLSLYSAD